MSIDRTNFNALIDDDGSNTVGSIWNKQAIKNVLLDPMDAALAVVPWSSGLWTPTVGGSATYSLQTGQWVKLGPLVTIQMILTINTIGSGSASAITGLPFAGRSGVYQTVGVGAFNTLTTPVSFIAALISGGIINITGSPAVGNAASFISVLGNGSTLYLGGSYLTDL